LFYAACLATEAEWEIREKGDAAKQELAEFFFDRRVERREPRDISDYPDRVRRLSAEL